MNQIHLQYNSGKDTSYQNHHTTKHENQFFFSSITHMQATKKVCNTKLKKKKQYYIKLEALSQKTVCMDR